MKRSFNSLLMFPPAVWFITISTISLICTMATYDSAYYFIVLLVITPCYTVCSSSRMHMRLPWLYRPISTHFHAIRTLHGEYVIVQKKLSCQSCAQLRRSLAQELDIGNLLPPGRYITITHPLVIKRLNKAENVEISRSKPIYQCDLKPTLTAMTSGQCVSCQSKCSAWNTDPVQFYKIHLIKKEKRPSPFLD